MPNWWMIFSPNAFFFCFFLFQIFFSFPFSNGRVIRYDDDDGWWVFVFLLPFCHSSGYEIGAGKRALGRRLDWLNQSIYIQLRGCFLFPFYFILFFYFLLCVREGGWEVRALMILKWQGPEFSDLRRPLPPSSCFSLPSFIHFFLFFIYRFIALHSYIETRIHSRHTHMDTKVYAGQPFHLAAWNICPGPFPLAVVVFIFFLSYLLLLLLYIFNSPL